MKLKIGPGWDVEPCRRLRAELGPDFGLQVDANAAYGPGDIETLRALDEFDLLVMRPGGERRHAGEFKVGSTVKLGKRTFFGHVQAIWGTEEVRDLKDGVKAEQIILGAEVIATDGKPELRAVTVRGGGGERDRDIVQLHDVQGRKVHRRSTPQCGGSLLQRLDRRQHAP